MTEKEMIDVHEWSEKNTRMIGDCCIPAADTKLILGEPIKVKLEGETPWAVVVEILPDGKWLGEIGNILVNTEGHGLQLGDLATFELVDHAIGTPQWVPVAN